MQIANLIRRIRLTNNLSQSQLAEKLKVTRNHVSYIENGLKLPSLDVLDRLGEAFQYNPYWLKGLWIKDILEQTEEKLKRKAGLE
jgi:transcriptional regulator with XRE-family HTH domain